MIQVNNSEITIGLNCVLYVLLDIRLCCYLFYNTSKIYKKYILNLIYIIVNIWALC